MELSIEPANRAEIDAVRGVLQNAGLPTDGLGDQFPDAYVVHRVRGAVVASAGLEQHGKYGLLRSVAVAAAHQKRGLGRALIASRIGAARLAQLRSIHVLTTTARTFFLELGFIEVDRASVPPEIAASREFRETCPSTATCLVFSLE
jgi:N-acetylglutamate synthase-like GNAT family acetyltransferase